MTMNKMPEVAKMLGVEIGDKFNIKGAWNNPYEIREGVYGYISTFNNNGKCRDEALVMLLNGKWKIEKLPRYTIPEDTPVDAKVWVKGHIENKEWKPVHFCRIDKFEVYKSYVCYSNRCSSFTAESGTTHWNHCITDEEYQKRQGE